VNEDRGGRAEHDGPRLPDPVRAQLRREETWAVPPATLEGDVLAALRRERDAPETPAPARSGAAPRHAVDLGARRDRRAARRGWAGRRGLAAAAVAAGTAVAGWALLGTPAQEDVAVVTLAATELAPAASGRAEVRATPSGFAVELDLEGLPPAPAGTYYQAWLKNPAGDLVTVGTFHGRDGAEDVVGWSGVDPRDYSTLTVTVQREGAGPASSGQVVLRGAIPTP
jgi:Anti-sigma-K factor rskA